MTVYSDTRASMLAQIVQGVPKDSSHLVTDSETSRVWDEVAAGVADLDAKHPGAVVDVPADVPSD